MTQPQNPNGDAPGMTAGELRKALEGVADETPVTIRAEDTEGNTFCGGIVCAGIERAHDEDETVHFAIDCTDDEGAFDE